MPAASRRPATESQIGAAEHDAVSTRPKGLNLSVWHSPTSSGLCREPCLSSRRCASCSIIIQRIVHHRLPSAHALQYPVGMFDRVHMTIMLFDHFDRCAHLLRKDINI